MSNKIKCLFAGLRHISVLKLLGTELADMGGVLELYPINGKVFFLLILDSCKEVIQILIWCSHINISLMYYCLKRLQIIDSSM